ARLRLRRRDVERQQRRPDRGHRQPAGKQAADTLYALWADHLENVVLYTTGVATQDAQRRATAANNLHGFEDEFAVFLQVATSLGFHDENPRHAPRVSTSSSG